MPEIKLNVGCGEMILPGYVNIDLYSEKADVKADAKQLPFTDEYADEILTSHVIEHFGFHEGFEVLREWKRVLKTGGKLVIECPDLEAICRLFVTANEQERIEMYPQLFGHWNISGYGHKFVYTPSQLAWTLEQVGFQNIQRVPPCFYYNIANRCMRFICEK